MIKRHQETGKNIGGSNTYRLSALLHGWGGLLKDVDSSVESCESLSTWLASSFVNLRISCWSWFQSGRLRHKILTVRSVRRVWANKPNMKVNGEGSPHDKHLLFWRSWTFLNSWPIPRYEWRTLNRPTPVGLMCRFRSTVDHLIINWKYR